MNKREFLKRAVDSSGFHTFDADAQRVNPNVWNRQLAQFAEANLVITPLAQQVDFREAGSNMYIHVASTPSAAAAVVDTDDVSISTFENRRVTFTPAEYGAAYQVTRAEAVRGFFPIMEQMTRELGYALALKKDNLAYSALLEATDNGVVVNTKTALTDIQSTDSLDYSTILRAQSANAVDYHLDHFALIVSPKQLQQLLALGTINKANEFGTRDAISRGVVGTLFGAEVVVSHSVTDTTTGSGTNRWSRAVLLSRGPMGNSPFAYAIKRDPIIEQEYHALGRYWDVVAHEEYDFAVTYPNAICVITTGVEA